MTRARWILSCVLMAACQARGDDPGIVVLPGMHYPLTHQAYDEDPVVGPTLRQPPEGTVPYGGETFAYGTGEEEARRAARELHNPLRGTPEEIDRGKRVFDIYCKVCHGAGGVGDGPIIGRFPNPPNLLADKAKQLSDGQVFHILTRGQGIMPPYAVQVRPLDRWKVIHYVRRLQGVPGPVQPPPAEAIPVDAFDGGSGDAAP